MNEYHSDLKVFQLGYFIEQGFPLVNLTVSTECLSINTFLFGNYKFTPQQVVSFDIMNIVPILCWGVRVRHINKHCPEPLIIYCLSNPNNLIKRIKETGFEPTCEIEDDSIPGPSHRKLALFLGLRTLIGGIILIFALLMIVI